MEKTHKKKALGEQKAPETAAAPKRTRKRSNSTRDGLLVTAVMLLWEKGYAETTLAELAARAGVHGGSVYYFFKTKEELLLAVLDRYSEMLYPALLNPAWENVTDPIEKVFALLGRYREAIIASGFTYGCPVGRLAMEISPQMVEAHAKIAGNFEGWSSAVRGCLEAAGNRLPRGLDLVMLSRFVLTVMEGGVMQSRSYRTIEPFDQAVAQLRDYFNRLEAQAVSEGASYWNTLRK